MSAFIVIQVDVTNQEKYEDYKKLTPASVEKYGGKFLVRGGERKDLEGQLEYSRLVLLEFPDMPSAERWYNSPEYQEAKALREGASNGIFTLVQGT